MAPSSPVAMTGELPGVDLAAVAAWMAGRGLQLRPPLRGRRVGRGQSNLTYRLEDADGRRWVLRRPPLGNLLGSAHDVDREHRILAALADTDVPVPEVVGLRHAAGAQLVMEHVDGLVVDRMDVAEHLPDTVRAELGPSMVRTLAAIHAVDLDRTGLLDLASHRPYAQRQLKRWARQLEASRTRETPALDRLSRRLTQRTPHQRETVLVHGDLHLRNVMCSPDTGRVRAALDWELSTLGDPMADLGTLLAYWPEAGEAPPGLFAASVLPGFARREELVATYLSVSGGDGGSLGFWHVLGLWKVAIIAEGVRRRALEEPRNAAEGGPPAPAVIDHLVDRAWDLVGHYRL